ncbi:hypothetical protein SLE2022_083610 [Rubroshorea leprosula]
MCNLLYMSYVYLIDVPRGEHVQSSLHVIHVSHRRYLDHHQEDIGQSLVSLAHNNLAAQHFQNALHNCHVMVREKCNKHFMKQLLFLAREPNSSLKVRNAAKLGHLVMVGLDAKKMKI